MFKNEPKKSGYTWTTFALRKEQDRLIIDWLSGQANKSQAIRKALAEAIVAQDDPSQLAEILDILRELRSGQFTITAPGNGAIQKVKVSEPEDITESLNSLGM